MRPVHRLVAGPAISAELGVWSTPRRLMNESLGPNLLQPICLLGQLTMPNNYGITQVEISI